MASKSSATMLNNVSNNATFALPYRVEVKLHGIAPILFHRWDCDEVSAKSQAAKGSTIKKTDNWQSYLYLDDNQTICVPSTYLHQAIANAAKFWQDPRSPRKSLYDLARAAFIITPYLASTGKKEPDYLDRRRVLVQRNGITRVRPALLPGWEVEFVIECVLPEYFPPETLHELISQAGRLVGLGDFRPTFGRFQIVKFELLDDQDEAVG